MEPKVSVVRFYLLIHIPIACAGKIVFGSSAIALTTMLLAEFAMFWLSYSEEPLGRVGSLLVLWANPDFSRKSNLCCRCWGDMPSLRGNILLYHLGDLAIIEDQLALLVRYTKRPMCQCWVLLFFGCWSVGFMSFKPDGLLHVLGLRFDFLKKWKTHLSFRLIFSLRWPR